VHYISVGGGGLTGPKDLAKSSSKIDTRKEKLLKDEEAHSTEIFEYDGGKIRRERI